MIQLWSSDAVKQALAAIAFAAGILAANSPPGKLQSIAATIYYTLGSLGIVSGGTTGTQPHAVKLALGLPPPPVKVETKTTSEGGFIDYRLGSLLAIAAVVALLAGLCGCATAAKVSGSTGPIDFGHGYVCSITAAATDPATCTKVITQACEIPIPKDETGGCSILESVNATVPFDPGHGAKCQISAAPAVAACTKLVTNSCTVPVPRDASGGCN